MKRRKIFKLIELLIPIIFFVLLECVLILIKYGETYPLFVEDPINPKYYVINEDVTLRYFESESFKAIPQYDPFLKSKKKSTFRIVVQGESTAYGFPYMHGASFPRLLKHKLQMYFPNQEIEVINIGLSAINSYTLLDLRKEIAKLKPDLIIISAGHNEYYGAFGVGSTQNFSSSPFIKKMYLKLKYFRTVQLLKNIVQSFKREKHTTHYPRTVMQRMVKEKYIPINSELYYSGLKQFEQNFSALLKYYKSVNIPVIALTQVYNEKDHKPFHSTTVNENVKNNIDRLITENKFNQASQLLIQSTDSLNAFQHYMLAKNALLNDFDSIAGNHFIKAKEYDLLRFRAPEKINTLIKDISQEYDAQFIDMISIFRENSGNKVIGYELMSEHLHPNIQGYKLMANTIFDHLTEQNQTIKSWESDQIALAESLYPLITIPDSLIGVFLTLRLKSTWPFKETSSSVDSIQKNFTPQNITDSLTLSLYLQQINWFTAMSKLHQFYLRNNEIDNVLLVSQALAQEFPNMYEPFLMAGDAAFQLKKFNLALFYYKKAYSKTLHAPIALHIYKISIKIGLFKQAVEYLTTYNKQIKIDDFETKVNKIYTHQDLIDGFNTDSANLDTVIKLIESYRYFELNEEAEKLEMMISN